MRAGEFIARHLVRGFAMGFGAFIALLVFVFATGSTFGQRCAKVYPTDERAAERCEYEMAHGLRRYPSEDPNR